MKKISTILLALAALFSGLSLQAENKAVTLTAGTARDYQRVEISDQVLFAPAADGRVAKSMTMSAWVRFPETLGFTSSFSGMPILGHRAQHYSNDNGSMLLTYTSAGNYKTIAGVGNKAANFATSVKKGEWTLLTMTYDADSHTFAFYADGEELGSYDNGKAWALFQDNNEGTYPLSTIFFIGGAGMAIDVDEILLYDRALSAMEVILEQEAGAELEGLVALYDFNEPTEDGVYPNKIEGATSSHSAYVRHVLANTYQWGIYATSSYTPIATPIVEGREITGGDNPQPVDGPKDILNAENFGISATGAKNLTYESTTSDAEYFGRMSYLNGAITLSTAGSGLNKYGILTTKSAGKLKSVTVKFNGSTGSTSGVYVYAKNEEYSSTAELATSERGEEVAKLVASDGLKQTYTFTEDYEYVAFASVAGSVYFDEIVVEWAGAAAAVEPVFTLAAVENGTLEVLNGGIALESGAKVAEGTELTLKATPAEGYEFVTFTLNGEAYPNDTYTVGAADFTLGAEFDEKTTVNNELEKTLLTEKSLPMSFDNDKTFPWIVKDGIVTSTNYANRGTTASLKATFTIDKQSKLSFQRRVGSNNINHYCEFYINDKLYNSTYNSTAWGDVSVVLEPGRYTVEWVDSNNTSGSSYFSQIQNVELHHDWVEVDITPGYLGVEVLYKVNVLKDVELLKINGEINSDDWATIKQMSNIHAIDFENAQISAIPDNGFKGLSSLSTVKLPEGVKTIGSNSFENTQIYHLTIPSTVTSIGAEAFYNTRLQYITFLPNSELKSIGYQAFRDCTWLEEFIMPNSVTTLSRYNNSSSTSYEANTFRNCTSLKKLKFSDSIVIIPLRACDNNSALTDLSLPSNLKTVESYAFRSNSSLVKLNIPETVATIEKYAFANTAVDSVRLPLKLTKLESEAFGSCKNLKYVELPSSISDYDYSFYNSTNIETVVCPSATPPSIKNNPFYGCTISAMNLLVPSFALVNYKLDNYWYQFGNILEYDTPVDYWRIIGDLRLLNNRRMEGKPDIDLSYGGCFTVGGDAPMTVGSFEIYQSEENPSRLVNSCNAFTADSMKTHFSVAANKWYFLTPMADVNIADIKVDNTTSFVFRYYDGTNRASTGMGSSWKNVTDTKLKAGQGYIFQCNAASVVTFPVATDLHEQILSIKAASIPLTAHASDNAANKGWNFVGNPYPCYYDIFYMDFTAPITVWTGSTYRAYSITDDNFVLRPMQGFFVQKPDDVDAIVLQTRGKQIEATVNRAANAPARARINNERALFNIEISTDSVCDMTRVVLNEKASLGYETECDATKFMSMEANISQIYTIDDDANRLAINERPEATGVVRLGIYVSESGQTHVISASRNDGDIYLHDAETNEVVNLGTGDYSFVPSAAGNIDNRFTLRLKAPETTAISAIESDNAAAVIGGNGVIYITTDAETYVTIYGIDGSMKQQLTTAGETSVEIAAGLYIVKVGNASYKIAVK